MVTRESASYPAPEDQDDIFSIDANHSEIVKFANSACPDYNNVRSRIIRLALAAQPVISNRFGCESGGRLTSAQGTARLARGVSSNFKSMFVQFQGERQGATFRFLL